jgi:2-octaprenyl-6-methoxyphenol hydroxylase
MQHKEIVIVGGGPIGLTTAFNLVEKGFKVTVLDSGVIKANDGRILALSYASVEFLKEYELWDEMSATAINEVHISHKGLGVSKICADDLALVTLGYTIKYADLCKILENKLLGNKGFELVIATVDEVIHGKNYATLTYMHNDMLNYMTADLVIMAEGGNSKILGVEYNCYDYAQTAVVAEIKAEIKPNKIAYERFGNDGGLVLLPYLDRYALVWSLSNQTGGIDQNMLQKKLQELSFMERFGKFSVSDKVHQFPLKRRFTRKRVFNNVILIGNSAQTIHPVSAQGMNIGLRDAKIVSDVIFNAKDDRTNSFCRKKLMEYDKLRSCDTHITLGFTHYLAKFIDLDIPITNHLRGAGIMALSNCKLLQNKIANSLIFGS